MKKTKEERKAEALEKYDKITDRAREEFEKIEAPAWEEYEKKIREIDEEAEWMMEKVDITHISFNLKPDGDDIKWI